jgi:hypothetical protein
MVDVHHQQEGVHNHKYPQYRQEHIDESILRLVEDVGELLDTIERNRHDNSFEVVVKCIQLAIPKMLSVVLGDLAGDGSSDTKHYQVKQQNSCEASETLDHVLHEIDAPSVLIDSDITDIVEITCEDTSNDSIDVDIGDSEDVDVLKVGHVYEQLEKISRQAMVKVLMIFYKLLHLEEHLDVVGCIGCKGHRHDAFSGLRQGTQAVAGGPG